MYTPVKNNCGFVTYELEVVSYELQFAVLRKKIYALQILSYELKRNFTSLKLIL